MVNLIRDTFVLKIHTIELLRNLESNTNVRRSELVDILESLISLIESDDIEHYENKKLSNRISKVENQRDNAIINTISYIQHIRKINKDESVAEELNNLEKYISSITKEINEMNKDENND